MIAPLFATVADLLSARKTTTSAVAGILVALALASGPGGVATADPVGDTQGQIDALEAQVAAGATRIHALTGAYQQANLESAALSQEMATDAATLKAMQARLASSEGALRGQALRSYTGAGQQPTHHGAVGGTADPAVRAEYLLVATGNVADSVDQLRVERSRVEGETAVVSREQAQTDGARRVAGAARDRALRLAASEQAKLTYLQGILAAQTAFPAPSRTQGAPVNGGLLAAVQNVVGIAAGAGPGGGGAGGNWARLRQCESGGNYQASSGNGFYGAYQFSASTWNALGYPGRPDQEPAAMQDAAAMALQAQSGWDQWPACSAALGLG